jgi:signal transduction histidine kinase
MRINFKSIKARLLIFSFTIILLTFTSFVLAIMYIKSDISYQSAEAYEHALFILIPILFMLMIGMVWFLINNILKKVQYIIDDVKDIKIDDFTTRVTVLNTNDEIDELIHTFNNMLDKIEQSVNKIKRFSNDVSHELKTPLTVIIGELELGLRKPRNNEEYKEILNTSLNESRVLKELIDNLLFLSNMDDKSIKSKFKSVDIDEVIIDVISSFNILLDEKKIKIEFKDFDNISINANEQLLKVMLSNIIQNSIKYSNNNSKIEITLKNEICIIKDYGIGIENKYLKKLTDRFYRVDESRSRGGYGLGLSIVKDIANLHNIQMQIKSKYGEFTQVTFMFHS